jgi:Ca2+-binding RTX toxin-like protein
VVFFPGSPDDDLIDGGAENDLINGLAGSDTLNGNDGIDTIFGGDGDDRISGGNGADFLYGGSGQDRISGGAGGDVIQADAGFDVLVGDAGNDFLYGGDDTDWMGGGTDNDYLDGGSGNDFLSGEDGNDILLGSLGNDTLVGGLGNDSLYGGLGQDSFGFGAFARVDVGLLGFGGITQSIDESLTYNPAFGVDTIYDFTIGQDRIYLSRVLVANRDEIAFVQTDAAAAASPGRVVYSRGSGNLFFNPNTTASGFGNTGGQFAAVVGIPNLSATDFVTVAEAFNGFPPITFS